MKVTTAAATTGHRYLQPQRSRWPLTPHPFRGRRRCYGCCFLFAAYMVRQAVPATAAAGRPPPSPLSRCCRRCHACSYLLAADTFRQTVTRTPRRYRRQPHSRRPLNSFPAHQSPPPLLRLRPSLYSGFGWVRGTGGRPRRPPTSLPALHSPPPLPRLLLSLRRRQGQAAIGPVPATAAATTGRRHRQQQLPAAHPPRSPVAVAVAATFANSQERIPLRQRCHRLPLPRRPAVAAANNSAVHDR